MDGAGGIILGTTAATGTLGVTSTGGAITETGVATVGGVTTLAATSASSVAADITLGTATNDFQGAVTTSGANITLADGTGGIILGNTTATGNLAVTSTGAGVLGGITQTAGTTVKAAGVTTLVAKSGSPVVMAQAIAKSASGPTQLAAVTPPNFDINLSNVGNDFNTLKVTTSGAVTVKDTNNLALTALSSGANSAVDVEALGLLTLPTTAINTGTANLLLSSGQGLTLQAPTSGANVTLIGTAVSEAPGSSLVVAGTTNVTASTSASLDQPANVFGGSVTVASPNVTVVTGGPLTLNLTNTGAQSVNAQSNGLTLSSASQAAETIDLSKATGAVVLKLPSASSVSFVNTAGAAGYDATSYDLTGLATSTKVTSSPIQLGADTQSLQFTQLNSVQVTEIFTKPSTPVFTYRIDLGGNQGILSILGLTSEGVTAGLSSVVSQEERDEQGRTASIGLISDRVKANSIGWSELTGQLEYKQEVNRAACSSEQNAGEVADSNKCK